MNGLPTHGISAKLCKKKKKIDFLEVGEKMCSQRWSSFLGKLVTRSLWARSQNMQQLNCFVGDRPLINIGHYLEIKRLKNKMSSSKAHYPDLEMLSTEII